MANGELAHEIIQDLKRVASDLGHTPSRDEYRAHGKISDRQIKNAFSNYAAARIAAGLEPVTSNSTRRKKITKEDLFGKDIREIAPKPSSIIKPACDDLSRVLILGDTHFPWVSPDALMSIYSYVDSLPDNQKPTHIVQLGDLHDMLSWSKFPTSKHTYNPVEEINLAYEMAQSMWATLKKLVPEAECHQLLGNHDVRPLKRILESFPEGEIFFSIDRYYQFTGVKTHLDPRSPLQIGNTLYFHGYRSRSLDHWNDFPGVNVVHGHLHGGSIHHRRFGNKVCFMMDAGFLGQPEAKCFGYMPMKTLSKFNAFAWKDSNGPRLITI